MEHLHELLENVLTVYRGKLLSAGIRVETDFNDLQRSRQQGEMIQASSDTLANAIDAMAHGHLRISTRKTRAPIGDGVLTTIRDEGAGIRTEHLERIFDPFFTTKGEVGTGIGLWVARELVEKRGGQIGVVSNTETGSSGTSVSIFRAVY